MDRGKKAGARPGTVGSGSPAAAGERWTSERQSSDQGALFKEATSELRAGVRRRHRMAGLRKGLLEEEEEAPRLPACPRSRGASSRGPGPHGGRVLTEGASSRGHVLTGSRPHGGARPYGGGALTRTCPHGRGVSSRGRGSHGGASSPCLRSPGRGDSDPQGLQPLPASLPTCFLFPCLFSQGEHPSVGSPLSGSPRVLRSPLPHSLMSAV